MSIKTNAELTAQNNAAIRVNGNREITPAKHNEINKNIFDSYLNIKDGGQVVQVEAGYSSSIPLTQPTSFAYKSWVEGLIATYGTYLGTWDANTNTPTITSGVGTNGDYYYVAVAGTTTIDGISSWSVGDKIIFNGTAWELVPNYTNLSLGVSGILPVANGGTGQSDYTLRDNTNEYSLDWANRNLFDSGGELSIDYTGKTLHNGTATVLKWGLGILNDLNGIGIKSIDFNTRELYDNTATRTVDYNNRKLYYTGGQESYNWANNILLYSNGNSSINASDGTLYDTTGTSTLNYSDKQFKSLWSFISENELRFNDLDNSNYVGIKAPTNVSTSYSISLPSAPPSSGQYLGWNGSNYVWNTITSGLSYLGTWNANTNTPSITSGVGTNGQYYVVSVAGTTNIDGINDWGVGDWIMFNGTAWQKIDNSDRVSSVDGMTGAVSLASSYQPLNTNLNSLSGLTYASTSFVKMTASGTFALDTNTYASTSDLTAYAKLDGSNTPFTGNVTIQKTNPQFKVQASTGYSQIYITSDSSSDADLLIGGNKSKVRFFNNSYGTERAYIETTSSYMLTSISGTSYMKFRASGHGGTYGNEITLENGVGIKALTQQDFIVQNDTGSNYFKWTASSSQLLLRENSTDKIIFNPTLQNSGLFNNGIKIGNNTDIPSTAGGGAIKYNGGLFYGSDGSNWGTFLTSTSLKVQSKTTDVADINNGGASIGIAYWVKITADNSGDVDRIACFVTSAAAENIYLGIYSNAGSKLADATISSGSVVAGINTATLSSTVSLVAGTQYWLCVKDNNSGSVNLGYSTCLSNSNICKSLFVGAGSLPANDTGATAANSAFYISVFKS